MILNLLLANLSEVFHAAKLYEVALLLLRDSVLKTISFVFNELVLNDEVLYLVLRVDEVIWMRNVKAFLLHLGNLVKQIHLQQLLRFIFFQNISELFLHLFIFLFFLKNGAFTIFLQI